jgi:hypothetical protein
MRIAWVACIAIVLAQGCSSPRGAEVGGTIDAGDACAPNGSQRCIGSTYQTCTNGTWQTAIDCPQYCVDTLGCVECSPGQPFCKDGNVWQCDGAGNPGMQTEVCTGGNTCSGGYCVDACADAANNRSYIGCEYWAVDLDNAIEVRGGSNGTCTITGAVPLTLNVCYTMMGGGIYAGLCDPQDDGTAPHTCPGGSTCQSKLVCANDAQHGPFAVVVSNPHATSVDVTVTGPAGQTINRTVASGAVVPILMQSSGIPDQSVDGTGKFKKAYKIVSTLPIVAYQFNPLDNVNVFSNDASLLIPRTTFDTDYYVMSWQTLNRRAIDITLHPYYGYLTVVAWQDDTQIAVTPTTAVMASATQTTINRGVTASFTLNAFEVLQLQARPANTSGDSGDLTGTHIVATNGKTFGVFGGHEASVFGETTPPDPQHDQGPGFADHLEEMLFPSSTWGLSFAIARSKQRTNEPDYVRILAQKAGTQVTFKPAVFATVAGDCASLGPGQFCDVKVMGDTEISSTQPILVGHFLESSTWFNRQGSVGTGDPSMAIAVPTEQFRKDYAVLVPSQYAENYISIAAAATGGVTIDNVPVTLTPFPGGGTHRAARVLVPAGQHKITCADGCGITVYGYSDGVSYMFAGGLDLKPIVVL